MRSHTRRRTAASVAVAAVVLCTPAAAGEPALPAPAEACHVAAPRRAALVGVRDRGRLPWLRRAAHVAGGHVAGRLDRLHALQVAFGSEQAAARFVSAMRAHPDVRFADVDTEFSAFDTPIDPLYPQQWALRKVGAPAAWSVEPGTGAPVTVAVIDTGADFAHPDLEGKLTEGLNLVTRGAPAQDDHVHGTHVSGIVAATTNNGAGVAGMSWTARIVPVKALDARGKGSLCDVTAAILYSASQGVDVVNMSLGGHQPCPAVLQAAVDVAHASGAVLIAAAGNDGAGFNLPSSPAECEHVVGVSATDQDDRPAGFSNHGYYVDVSAPGVAILSTALDPVKGRRGYAAFDGTSMAAPMVAGLAALLAARHPAWTPDQIVARILATSRDLGPRGWDERFGAGRIDAAKALR